MNWADATVAMVLIVAAFALMAFVAYLMFRSF